MVGRPPGATAIAATAAQRDQEPAPLVGVDERESVRQGDHLGEREDADREDEGDGTPRSKERRGAGRRDGDQDAREHESDQCDAASTVVQGPASAVRRSTSHPRVVLTTLHAPQRSTRDPGATTSHVAAFGTRPPSIGTRTLRRLPSGSSSG